MKKIQAVSIPEYFASGFPPVENPIVSHFKRHKDIYIEVAVISATTIIISGCMGAAASPIDKQAQKIYTRLCGIGKWVIAIRGAVEIIGCMSQGDLETMKKKIIVYVCGFVALLGLPWLLDQAQLLFEDPAMSIATS